MLDSLLITLRFHFEHLLFCFIALAFLVLFSYSIYQSYVRPVEKNYVDINSKNAKLFSKKVFNFRVPSDDITWFCDTICVVFWDHRLNIWPLTEYRKSLWFFNIYLYGVVREVYTYIAGKEVVWQKSREIISKSTIVRRRNSADGCVSSTPTVLGAGAGVVCEEKKLRANLKKKNIVELGREGIALRLEAETKDKILEDLISFKYSLCIFSGISSKKEKKKVSKNKFKK